jgi:hypothetical protein
VRSPRCWWAQPYGSSPRADAKRPPAADPAVITAWNAIAVATIAGPHPMGRERPTPRRFLWFSFVHAAIYKAVVDITGEFELYV